MMYLVAIAWAYVVLMAALAEALSPQGTILGALFTLLLYGILPLGIVLYILGAPLRRRARLAADRPAPAVMESPVEAGPAGQPDPPASAPSASGPAADQPDGGGHAAGAAVAPERKEP